MVNWDWCTCNYSISSLRQILSNTHTKQFRKMMNTLWQVFFEFLVCRDLNAWLKVNMKMYDIILVHFELLGPNTKHILFATPDFSWIFTENIQLKAVSQATPLLRPYGVAEKWIATEMEAQLQQDGGELILGEHLILWEVVWYSANDPLSQTLRNYSIHHGMFSCSDSMRHVLWLVNRNPLTYPPLRNKALLRGYEPLVSLSKALFNPYFCGWSVSGGPCYPNPGTRVSRRFRKLLRWLP